MLCWDNFYIFASEQKLGNYIPTVQENVWFAYFAPFSYEEHERLVARCAASPLARVKSLGHTLDGRDIDLITAGTGKMKALLATGRQPGGSSENPYGESCIKTW